MNDKIYSKKNHSISKTEKCEDTFSLTINFFELAFEIDTLKLVDVFGFFPLIKAIETNINLPSYIRGDYCIRLRNNDIKKDEIYSYNKVAYTNGSEFQNSKIYYDFEKKLICIGEIDFVYIAIMVNDNIVCILDENGILRCLYILIDRFE